MSKLDSFIRRMQAQRACIDAACELIAPLEGVVFELGLGAGRTYSHLLEKLPGRDILVFERQIQAHAVCVPPEEHAVVGELNATLPDAVKRFAGQVALVHSDIGTSDPAYGASTAEFISRHLTHALCPNGVVLSDQALQWPGLKPIDLPEGVVPGRYHMYSHCPELARVPAAAS